MSAVDSGAVMTAQKSIWDMSKEEIDERMAKMARKAQQELHAKGLPYVIGTVDCSGKVFVYPDGRRVFTPYKEKMSEGR